MTNLRAHIYFPPEQIYLSQAEGTFCGIRVSARGQLIKRAEYQRSPSITPEEWQKRLSLAQHESIFGNIGPNDLSFGKFRSQTERDDSTAGSHIDHTRM